MGQDNRVFTGGQTWAGKVLEPRIRGLPTGSVDKSYWNNRRLIKEKWGTLVGYQNNCYLATNVATNVANIVSSIMSPLKVPSLQLLLSSV